MPASSRGTAPRSSTAHSRSILNINPHHFDVLSAEHPPDSDEADRAIAQAERHIIRHRILEGGEHIQHPGPDPLDDRRPGSLDELPPSYLDATSPQPGLGLLQHLPAATPAPAADPPELA